MQGWIRLHHSIVDWEWFTDQATLQLFIYLLSCANISDKKWKGTLVKRGELITGRLALAKRLGVSERSIRTSLTKLKTTNEVTIKTTNKYSVISINKYNEYQQNDQQNANKRPTTDQQLTTTKEYKNNKNIRKREGRNLTEQDFQEIAEKYNIPVSFVLSEWDSLQNWCAAKGKVYKDYKAALCNWVKKDAIERIEHANTNNLKRGIDASNL